MKRIGLVLIDFCGCGCGLAAVPSQARLELGELTPTKRGRYELTIRCSFQFTNCLTNFLNATLPAGARENLKFIF